MSETLDYFQTDKAPWPLWHPCMRQGVDLRLGITVSTMKPVSIVRSSWRQVYIVSTASSCDVQLGRVWGFYLHIWISYTFSLNVICTPQHKQVRTIQATLVHRTPYLDMADHHSVPCRERGSQCVTVIIVYNGYKVKNKTIPIMKLACYLVAT